MIYLNTAACRKQLNTRVGLIQKAVAAWSCSYLHFQSIRSHDYQLLEFSPSQICLWCRAKPGINELKGELPELCFLPAYEKHFIMQQSVTIWKPQHGRLMGNLNGMKLDNYDPLYVLNSCRKLTYFYFIQIN